MSPASPTEIVPGAGRPLPSPADPHLLRGARSPEMPGVRRMPGIRRGHPSPGGVTPGPGPDNAAGVPFSVRDLHVLRGDVMALRGVDLDIPAGALTLLCGGNGSGKSTLLLALAGVLPIHSGRVEGLDGTGLALVPQIPPVPQRLPLTVGAAVAMGRWGGRGLFGRMRRGDREVVGERMRLLGVDALAQRQLCEVSGGQRQRALVAQALVREAPVLLLDEPTAAADAASRELIHHAARVEADGGATVVLATHDPGARDVADVVITLDSGRVIGVEMG